MEFICAYWVFLSVPCARALMRIRINRPPSGTLPNKGTAAQLLVEAGQHGRRM
jgi:hypothetical protein